MYGCVSRYARSAYIYIFILVLFYVIGVMYVMRLRNACWVCVLLCVYVCMQGLNPGYVC